MAGEVIIFSLPNHAVSFNSFIYFKMTKLCNKFGFIVSHRYGGKSKGKGHFRVKSWNCQPALLRTTRILHTELTRGMSWGSRYKSKSSGFATSCHFFFFVRRGKTLRDSQKNFITIRRKLYWTEVTNLYGRYGITSKNSRTVVIVHLL